MREDCSTCREWDKNFVSREQNIEGLCEKHGYGTMYDFHCHNHKIRPTIKIQRIYYKLKSFIRKTIERIIR